MCKSTDLNYDGSKGEISIKKGLTAEFLGEPKLILRKVLQGDVQIVFTSPENLLDNENFQSMLLTPKYKKLIALVIDEAHCVKTWLVLLCTLCCYP